MEQASTDMKQNRMTEFLKLLPLTIELAGLPKGELGRSFTPDQIEGRAIQSAPPTSLRGTWCGTLGRMVREGSDQVISKKGQENPITDD